MNCPNCGIALTLTSPHPTKTLQLCAKCGFTAPKNYLVIEKLYAFVSVDPVDQNEGVIAYRAPSGIMMPMVGGDWERVESMRGIAERVARESGIEVKLIEFANRRVVETIGQKK